MFDRPVTSCKTCPLAPPARKRCAFTPERREAGALVYAKGDLVSSVYFVREGVVAVGARSDPTTKLSLRGPRSLFGLETLRGERAQSDVWAVTTSWLCSLPGDRFSDWLGPREGSARTVVELLTSDLLNRAPEAEFQQGDCLVRVANLLLALAQADRPKIPKQVLARVSGIRAETLSRCLKHLADAGAIAPRSTQVIDHSVLQRFITQGDPSVRAARGSSPI
jgi:CRP-like cAMP-binding protein